MQKQQRWIILGILLAALWPRLAWYGSRLSGGGGHLLVVLPLLLATVWTVHAARATPTTPVIRTGLWLAAAGLLLHAATYHAAPLLVSGSIAALTLSAALSALFLGRVFHHGLAAMLILSLPVIASFNFYLGFPLRLCSAQLARLIMLPTGMVPALVGTCLKWGDQLVFIDAPCGGVRMLWTAGVLTASLICWLRLSLIRSLILGACAFLIVLAGNGFRTASLFVLETGNLPLLDRHHDRLHSGTGLVVFAGCATIILLLGLRLGRRTPATDEATVPPRITTPPPLLGRSLTAGLLLAALLCAGVPLLDPPRRAPQVAPFPGWPQQFEGRALTPLPPDTADIIFGDDFPGRIGRFTDGHSTYVIRWVDRPTRTLHRPAVCFEAIGYKLDYQPMQVDQAGRHWSRFDATQAGIRLAVRMQIIAADGASWPDTSAWYWAAASGRSQGPWWAFTIATPQSP